MRILSAKILDAQTQKPLPNVHVYVPGGIGITGIKYGTISDANGNFALNVEPEDILILRHIGYAQESYQSGDLRQNETFLLMPENYQLPEATVTAQSKKANWAGITISSIVGLILLGGIVRKSEMEKEYKKIKGL